MDGARSVSWSVKKLSAGMYVVPEEVEAITVEAAFDPENEEAVSVVVRMKSGVPLITVAPSKAEGHELARSFVEKLRNPVSDPRVRDLPEFEMEGRHDG